MRTTIRDREVLSALRPPDVMAYLRAAGWNRQPEVGDRASLWIYEQGGHDADVLIPNERIAGDFAIRMGELLTTLERVEGRAQEQIFEDINSSSADLVRIRALAEDAADGTLPLEAGVGLVEGARDLLAAAACAAVSPRPYWARRRPAQAVEYLNHLRLGQTERGSFVVTLVSPVAPALHAEGVTTAPFERRVTETLTRALHASLQAAQRAAETGNMEPFQQAVNSGVSANFCDALAALGHASPRRGLEVSVSWSRTRPGESARTSIQFAADYYPILEEASRVFKESATREDFLLWGWVVTLDRPANAPAGSVSVDAVVDDRPRRIWIDLPDTDYQEAIRAHRDRLPVTCTGELAKDGKSWRLRTPSGFRVSPAEV